MKYNAGSELDLLGLPTKDIWRKLSILELLSIEVHLDNPAPILGCLTNLQDLKLMEMP